MVTDQEYVLLATDAYRSDKPLPDGTIATLPNAVEQYGWTEITQDILDGGFLYNSGLFARAYRAVTGEIVVAYRGTEVEGGFDDFIADTKLIAGVVPDQLFKAVEF